MPPTERIRVLTTDETSRMAAVGAKYCSCVGCAKGLNDDELYAGEDLNPDTDKRNKGPSRAFHERGKKCGTCPYQASHKTPWPDWVINQDPYLARVTADEGELSTLELNRSMQKLPMPLKVWDLTLTVQTVPQTSRASAASHADRPPPPAWAMQLPSTLPPPPPPAIHLPPSDDDRAWADPSRGDNRYPYPHGGYRQGYPPDDSRGYYSDRRDTVSQAPRADFRGYRDEDPRMSSGSMQYGPPPTHLHGPFENPLDGRIYDTERRAYPSEYQKRYDDRNSGPESFRGYQPGPHSDMPPPHPIVKQESRESRGPEFTSHGGGPIRTTHARQRSTGSANSEKSSSPHPYWRTNKNQSQIKEEKTTPPPLNASPSASLMPPPSNSAGPSGPPSRSGSSDPNSVQGPIPRKPGDQYFGVKSPLWHDPERPGACHESSHQVILNSWGLAPSSGLPSGFGTCTGCGNIISTDCQGAHWIPGTDGRTIFNGRMGCQRALFVYPGPSQDTAMPDASSAQGMADRR